MFKRLIKCVLAMSVLMIFGGTNVVYAKEIIRIGHNQSSNHPTHIGMEAFKEYIEGELGDKYEVQIFPSELLGTQTNMVQLTQTGAIEMTVASNSIMETFNPDFQIFNLPYLFESPEIYHAVMNDDAIVGPIFTGTRDSGFIVVAWLDAGTRNFYLTDHFVDQPEDLRGMKVRVQQSPTNVRMMELLGGSATPMGFGEVYTAMQAGVIDGAENNELALTENGHGDVAKYYSYTLHQMIPDEVIASVKFLDKLSEEEREIFEKGFLILQKTQQESWQEKVKEAKDHAENAMKVEFSYPDIAPFREAVLPLHQEVLDKNPSLRQVYEQIEQKAEAVEKEQNND
ncbi:TRAP transporter substrate-binding protein DctP [Dolosicoccus paucivorans]|uniref:TRAP transporter substrate-binding protein DctP n=1 Tax=Dolosicoccus paucivorans TaxID=84521 RepID=A0A2N6SLF1_9LACT|nr:TRAP transporter substrate-binding protein [Dolosicoccus paucivorans]PMC57908.1 TRAP transporter substrate-binding protein DctP [Dolosicoccus paucivorans]